MESSDWGDTLNFEKPRALNYKIHQAEPKIMPFIVKILNTKLPILEDGTIPEPVERILLFTNAIFLKSEFAKQSFHIIETCYKKYARILEEKLVAINPKEFFPALKEIESLLFELGSILDFFAREINLALKLGFNWKNVSFPKVVKTCQKKYPDELLTKKLAEFTHSKFYIYFRNMRNRITHRLPFIIKGRNDKIFFPDDPENDNANPQTEDQIDLFETSKEWLYKILTFVDQNSIIVFKKIVRINATNTETGEKIDIEHYFKREQFVTNEE